ncbi:MAG: Asp-tRNA(Asn)/Glu-tRNA(Gln) amidotransferase subunit GatC [Candidatus Hydrothermarchaeota archaeon]
MSKVVISNEELKKVAEIARLSLNEEELKELRKEIESILIAFSQVEEMEIKEEELHYVVEHFNVFREDIEPIKFENPELIVNLAPRRKDRYFQVPRSL